MSTINRTWSTPPTLTACFYHFSLMWPPLCSFSQAPISHSSTSTVVCPIKTHTAIHRGKRVRKLWLHFYQETDTEQLLMLNNNVFQKDGRSVSYSRLAKKSFTLVYKHDIWHRYSLRANILEKIQYGSHFSRWLPIMSYVHCHCFQIVTQKICHKNSVKATFWKNWMANRKF